MTHLKHAGETLEDYCVARIASRRHADLKADIAGVKKTACHVHAGFVSQKYEMVRQISFCGNALDHASHGIRRACRTGASLSLRFRCPPNPAPSSRSPDRCLRLLVAVFRAGPRPHPSL